MIRSKSYTLGRSLKQAACKVSYEIFPETGPFDHRSLGMLADGCFDPRNGVAVQNELSWGDYFLFEALGFLSERISPDMRAGFALRGEKR